MVQFSGVTSGGSGFRLIHESLTKIQVYSDPINVEKDGDPYISLRIPGLACDAINPYFLSEFFNYLDEKYRINVTRLDLAFDYVPFSPLEFYTALLEGKYRSYAKQETINFHSSPFQLQETGEEKGCDTAQIGSRSSDRHIRVYNKRGFTRIELETKGERADRIAKEVLTKEPIYWGEQLLGHLRDFIDLVEDKDTGMLVDFWGEFIQSIPRAGLTVTDPREIEKNRVFSWLYGQVSPALSVYLDNYGQAGIDEIYEYGAKNRGDRYDLLLPDDKKSNLGDLENEE